MKDSAYIVFSAKGLQRMLKGTKAGGRRQRPQLGRGEFAVMVEIQVPDVVFVLRPIPVATVIIPEQSIFAAPITVEVVDPPPEEKGGPNESDDDGEAAGLSPLREPGDSSRSDLGEHESHFAEGEVRRVPSGNGGPA